MDYANVFVGTNETVELNCYHLYPSKCTWRISRTAEPSAIESNATDNMDKTFTVHTEGHLLKPKLKNTNIDIIGGNNSGKCNLKIRSFSAADEGSYTCKYWSISRFGFYKFYNVQLKSKYSFIHILYVRVFLYAHVDFEIVCCLV